MSWRSRFIAFAALSLAACRPDPKETVDGGPGTNAEGYCEPAPQYAEDVTGCRPRPDDYQPRVSNSANDEWPACISDDNAYHPINPNIATVARVAAFEEIATKLWKERRRPSAQDFVDARIVYAQDQGLDSRVQRREDVHYPPAPQPCSTAGIPDAYPDRCAGPAKLLPILNDAFAKGASGESPLVHAARIEAALLWFLYLSTLSEVNTCTNKPQDCDSSWAYYTGGTSREAPLGLARYVRELGVETHERAYDGTLAVRCWRNLDNETGTATNLLLRDRAREQLDRAMLRGIALVVRQRLTELPCSRGEVLEARWAFLTTLLPFLDRASRERNPVEADVLLAQARASSPQAVDVSAAVKALDTLFPCP